MSDLDRLFSDADEALVERVAEVVTARVVDAVRAEMIRLGQATLRHVGERIEDVRGAEVGPALSQTAQDVLAVFHEAEEAKKTAKGKPGQAQSAKFLAKRFNTARLVIDAALVELEKAGKVYRRSFFKGELWYLVGVGPGPVKSG